jgi:hypothetical protein
MLCSSLFSVVLLDVSQLIEIDLMGLWGSCAFSLFVCFLVFPH